MSHRMPPECRQECKPSDCDSLMWQYRTKLRCRSILGIPPPHTHTCTHARMHACTHTHTHTHLHMPLLSQGRLYALDLDLAQVWVGGARLLQRRVSNSIALGGSFNRRSLLPPSFPHFLVPLGGLYISFFMVLWYLHIPSLVIK